MVLYHLVTVSTQNVRRRRTFRAKQNKVVEEIVDELLAVKGVAIEPVAKVEYKSVEVADGTVKKIDRAALGFIKGRKSAFEFKETKIVKRRNSRSPLKERKGKSEAGLGFFA